MNIYKRQEQLQMSHACFQQVSDNFYRVDKDRMMHMSVGSVVSGEMLECYKKIVPQSARITVWKLEDKS